MNKAIRFGIIGCGMIAGFHAQALHKMEWACLVGVADTKLEYAVGFSIKHNVRAFGCVDEMIHSGEIDAVCICTPSGLHAQQAIAAAQAGLHVVVEKPMALTLDEADEVIRVVEKNGVKLTVISQLRFSDTIRAVKKIIDAGALGRLVVGDISMKYYRSQQYYDNGGWRGTWKMDGGGALMNQGIHGIDLLRYLCGPVKSVYGRAVTLVHNIETEDTVAAVVEYENGAVGTIVATTSALPGSPRRLEICGSAGSVTIEEDAIVKWEVPGVAMPQTGAIGNAGTANDPSAISSEGHYLQLSEFVDAVNNNRKPLVDAIQGKLTVELITAIYESSNKGCPVYLNR